MNDDLVTVICQGESEKGKRKALYDFYAQGARECDGSEADRYSSIAYGLKNGHKVCNDEWDY